MSNDDLEALLGLLGALRAHGVTKYETPEMCLELQPAWPQPRSAEMAAGGPEEEDFDPGKAYQEAIDKAAAAIVEANGKRS